MAENPTGDDPGPVPARDRGRQGPARRRSWTRCRTSMPEHQKFLSLVEERNEARKAIAEMDQNISAFEILAKSQKDPVRIPSSVVEPTVPDQAQPGALHRHGADRQLRPGDRPGLPAGARRPLGEGARARDPRADPAAAGRRAPDPPHGADAPGRATSGPRARPTRSRPTPSATSGPACWAIADRRGPIVTLLVTSPKAGDGKSTAALNLAATCARAGERTLLMDVDLRRPSLADVFPPDPTRRHDARPGGRAPGRRSPGRRRSATPSCATSTSSPPATRATSPSRSSGTLELRQLLIAPCRTTTTG